MPNEPLPFQPGQAWAPDFDRNRDVQVFRPGDANAHVGRIDGWTNYGVFLRFPTGGRSFYPFSSVSRIHQAAA